MRDRVTRRQFLKCTGAATFALSLPTRIAGQPPATAASISAVDRYNYIVGTQTFDPSYQFTDKPRLIETAQAIRDMGSSVIKLRLGHDRHAGSSGPRHPAQLRRRQSGDQTDPGHAVCSFRSVGLSHGR
jgi:hypothetical protein